MIDATNNCCLYIWTFVITGLWDVVLRLMSENYDTLPKYFQLDFIEYLKPYFEKHTLLAAALIAGFVGATTQMIIFRFHEFPTSLLSTMSFLLISFIISALYGFAMKGSKLFPHLEETYYKNLGTKRSMYTDGFSGLIVQVTLIFIVFFLN